jgi:hypothetical protein
MTTPAPTKMPWNSRSAAWSATRWRRLRPATPCDEISHYQGVGGVVELLEKIAQEDGNRKGEQIPLDGSGGHQFCVRSHML